MPATPSPSPSPADLASIAAPPEASVITIPQHVVSGARFTVKAQSAQDGVLSGTVTLQGENGMDFSSAPAGQTQSVAFTAPTVKRLTRYYIVATLVRAEEQPPVVTPISVYPADSP